jgi:hypothetical protein
VPPPEHHVHCHRCREAIVGIRYKVPSGSSFRSLPTNPFCKCTHMSCVDVNLCQNCEAVPAAAPGAHSSRHQLLKIREPALDEHQPLHRHHAICDACNAPIFGVRYKVSSSCLVRQTLMVVISAYIETALTSICARFVSQVRPHFIRRNMLCTRSKRQQRPHRFGSVTQPTQRPFMQGISHAFLKIVGPLPVFDLLITPALLRTPYPACPMLLSCSL